MILSWVRTRASWRVPGGQRTRRREAMLIASFVRSSNLIWRMQQLPASSSCRLWLTRVFFHEIVVTGNNKKLQNHVPAPLLSIIASTTLPTMITEQYTSRPWCSRIQWSSFNNYKNYYPTPRSNTFVILIIGMQDHAVMVYDATKCSSVSMQCDECEQKCEAMILYSYSYTSS